MGKMTNEQKNRFAIAEKVITRDALASGLTLEDLISVADYVERGAVWRKPAKTAALAASPVRGLSPAGWEAALKNAAKAGRSQQETEEHMNECSLCRELAELDARGELTAEVVKEKAAAAGIIARPRLDDEEKAAEAPSPVGEDPGDRGVLTQWAEAIRQQDAAREAAREARDLEVDPEEKAELERREKRDESLERGRMKLQKRPAAEEAGSWIVPLDEDELLAVAGRELYSPVDPEPERTEKIRNRKGEVWSYVSGAKPDGYPYAGWTADPANPWGIISSWTGAEMSRRGPWHVV